MPSAPSFRLTQARVPLCLVAAGGLAADRDGLTLVDLAVEEGGIASILPAGTEGLQDGPVLDLDGGIVLPRLVDCHVHLDKGHIWPRRRNPDGSFMGALNSVMADREANWSATDVRARMAFGLRCAFAHGTAAVRTHIDSL
ncbi:MAG: cytosine deaminase, partial [Methylobacterium sp.]|nr:cytosine deaminase [Methylobacterium sp.]